MLFAQYLHRMVKVGTLTIFDGHGRKHTFTGENAGRHATIRIHDPTLHRRLFLNPQLHLGEAYMAGSLTVENDDIYNFLAFCGENIGWDVPDHWVPRLRDRILRLRRRLAQHNPVPRARRNVAHHYDLSDTLYDLFLDRDRQYSCAYFMNPNDSIDQAQEQKKRHLAAKLVLQPQQKILDIGSGWGGLAISLAKVAKTEVTGITLSSEQYKFANQRAEREGLADRVKFLLEDYRQVAGTFDRIVSVGMFEHVGVGYYDSYFRRIHDLLADDGVALLHTIGRTDGPGATNPWISKYIFPGGYIPALSEVIPAIERQKLYIMDIEVLRLHYAETLKAWRSKFLANREKIRALCDARFCRMWHLYLAASEVAFRYSGHVVYQIQLAKQQDAVPLVRDYVTDFERAEAGAEWRAA